MGYTNTTTNYKLPQFVGSDKLSILGDLNTALLKIDESMKLISNSIATEDNKVKSEIQTQINSITTSISTINANILNFNNIKEEIIQAREGNVNLLENINNKQIVGNKNLLHHTSFKNNEYFQKYWTKNCMYNEILLDNSKYTPSGNPSIRFSVDGNNSDFSKISQKISLSNNTKYTFSVMVSKDTNYNEDGNLECFISYLDTTETTRYHTLTLKKEHFTHPYFEKYACTFTTGNIAANATSSFNIQVRPNGKWHGFVGDAQLRLGGQVGDWIPHLQDVLDESITYFDRNYSLIGMDTNRILKTFKHNDASNQSPWSYSATEDCFCFGSAWAHANDQYTPIFTLDGVQILKIGSGNNTLINIPIKKGQTLSLVDYGAYDLNIFGIKR